MAEAPALEVRGLNVFYGASHAVQGVDLTLPRGVKSVVGRNGMGKTTLCKAMMGLFPVASGSIRVHGVEVARKGAAEIARLGVGYVPQGRRLWRSQTVDEHLRLVQPRPEGAWTVERIYATFPRLAERRGNGGGQLSGGEQQMLAIARALLLNPRLLVMDEPAEGLAPLIVAQVRDLMTAVAAEGATDVLVIEQNIAVATSVAEQVSIMVNGRILQVVEARRLAADRALQQRLLGPGRHGEDNDETASEQRAEAAATRPAAPRVYLADPTIPTRWSRDVPAARIEAAARLLSGPPAVPELRPLATAGQAVELVAGTLDTKGPELRFIRDILKEQGLAVRLVDLSTTGGSHGADVPPHQVAAWHPRGAAGVFTGDRGESVAGMTEAFARWTAAQRGIAGMIGAGGSGGTAIVAPAMRVLPAGVPKLLISTVASGDVQKYVGASDIMMLHSVADVQGLNAITRAVLANGAHALAGMVRAREAAARAAHVRRAAPELPALGLTMFGVTTPAVRQVVAALKGDYDDLVFHATGIGGQAMEKLVDSGLIGAVIDLTTTEVCDMMMGGVFPATEDRFGAMIRARMPYVGSVGALDMVNFGPPQTVPERYAGRTFCRHNPQVTLMRPTPEECARMGRWIGERLNAMEGPVRFLLPEGGVSALDAAGKPFHDPAARDALFGALEATVRQTATRRLVRPPQNINDPEFAAEMVRRFRALHGAPHRRRA